MDGYNFFIQGWVSNVKVMNVGGSVKLLLANVKHSQSINAQCLQPNVVLVWLQDF